MISFEIHSLPKPINMKSGQHWAVIHKERMKWRVLVYHAIRTQIPRFPYKRAAVTFVRHSAKTPDFDGLVSSAKHLFDALVFFKVLEDDNMGVIGQPEFSWVKAPPKQGKVVITVTELVDSFPPPQLVPGK